MKIRKALAIIGLAVALASLAACKTTPASTDGSPWLTEAATHYGAKNTLNAGWSIDLPGTRDRCGWETRGVRGAFCADGDAYLTGVKVERNGWAHVTVDGVTFGWTVAGERSETMGG